MWSTLRLWLEEWHILEKPAPPLISMASLISILRLILVYTIRTAAFVFGVLPFLWLLFCECRGLVKLTWTKLSPPKEKATPSSFVHDKPTSLTATSMAYEAEAGKPAPAITADMLKIPQ
ncbi:hypothetical protein MEQU1_001151 [Malassezia equina]|uniref:Uncharacterized protein n=1 Tax=Malassezia equina TaxID=1381935 RepID=A0AAF0IY10_9BASI|nr:hypothetical protein MEQU1_001151 [Malassezia equina]